jgi:hypothetical protein
MMNHTLMLAMILSLIAPKSAQACSLDNYGVGEPLVTWTKRSVRVCWLSGAVFDAAFAKNDFSPKLKKAVQDIVQKEYTLDRTGIEFTGWQECTDLKEGEFDLAIFQDDYAAPTNKIVEGFRKSNTEGYAVLGEGSKLETITKTKIGKNLKKYKITKKGFFKRKQELPMMYLSYNKAFDKINGNFLSVDELQFTALHELGHVAGLRHEHARPEAKEDPNCSLFGEFKNEETYHDTTKIFGPYDANSIMNYCWGYTLLGLGSLYENLPNMTDETLVSSVDLVKMDTKTDEKTGEKKTVKTPIKGYKIRLGLSQQDVKALKAMYP